MHMYSRCNAGQCVLDPHSGTQSTGKQCIATCTCVVPHNCGQLLVDGAVCSGVQHTIHPGCSVCDKCCFAFKPRTLQPLFQYTKQLHRAIATAASWTR